MRRHLLLIAALGTIASCSGPTMPQGWVSARATAAGIVASNGTDRPVFYAAVEEGTLALVDLAACVEGSTCPTIPRYATITIPWADVIGYSPTRKTYLLMWSQPLPADPKAARSGQLKVVWP